MCLCASIATANTNVRDVLLLAQRLEKFNVCIPYDTSCLSGLRKFIWL